MVGSEPYQPEDSDVTEVKGEERDFRDEGLKERGRVIVLVGGKELRGPKLGDSTREMSDNKPSRNLLSRHVCKSSTAMAMFGEKIGIRQSLVSTDLGMVIG